MTELPVGIPVSGILLPPSLLPLHPHPGPCSDAFTSHPIVEPSEAVGVAVEVTFDRLVFPPATDAVKDGWVYV